MDEFEQKVRADFERPVETIEPVRLASPLVFSSPHSGALYPERFLAASRLDPLTLRRSEDAFVDELFLPCVSLGAPLIKANFPRAYLDVNREPYELDPQIFDGASSGFRQHPVAPGRRRARNDSASRRGRSADLSQTDAGRRGPCTDRGAVSPLPRSSAQPDRTRRASIRVCRVGRLPFDAEQRGRCRRPGRGAWRSARLQRLTRGRRNPRNEPEGKRLPRSPQQAFRRRLYHRAFRRSRQGVHAVQIELARGLYLDERTIVRTPGWTVFATISSPQRGRSRGSSAANLDLSRLAAE